MNEPENQTKNSTTINKMKKLLYEISSKNENLNKENSDLNEKILSLVKLLKVKDKIINKILQKYKLSLLSKLVLSKEKKTQNILRKCLNKMKIKNNFYNINNLYKTNSANFTFDKVSKKKKLNDIGVGNLGINLKFFIRKECCMTILSKWQFIKRSKENKEEMIKNLKISKSGYFDIDTQKIPNKDIQYKISKNNIDILRKKKNTIFYINKLNSFVIKGNSNIVNNPNIFIMKRDKSKKTLNQDLVITNMNMKIKICKSVASIGTNTDNLLEYSTNNNYNNKYISKKDDYQINKYNNYKINTNDNERNKGNNNYENNNTENSYNYDEYENKNNNEKNIIYRDKNYNKKYININFKSKPENDIVEQKNLSHNYKRKKESKENNIEEINKEVPIKEFKNLIQEENEMIEILGIKKLVYEKNETMKRKNKILFKIEKNNFEIKNKFIREKINNKDEDIINSSNDEEQYNDNDFSFNENKFEDNINKLNNPKSQKDFKIVKNKKEKYKINNNDYIFDNINKTLPKKSYKNQNQIIRENKKITNEIIDNKNEEYINDKAKKGFKKEKKFEVMEIDKGISHKYLVQKKIQPKFSIIRNQINIKGKIKNKIIPKLSIKKEQIYIKGQIKNNNIHNYNIQKEQIYIKGKNNNNNLIKFSIKKEQIYIKGKEKKEIKMIPVKSVTIKISPFIKNDKKVFKLKKENFSLLSKKIKNEIKFSIHKSNIKILSGKVREKETDILKNKYIPLSIVNENIQLISKNKTFYPIKTLNMETVEIFDFINNNNNFNNENEFDIENNNNAKFKNEKNNKFIDLEITKLHIYILSNVNPNAKNELINQQIIQIYDNKFDLFCKFLLFYQQKLKHSFFIGLILQSNKIKINFIINTCKKLLLSNKLHHIIRNKSKNELFRRFKQFEINSLKNEILFKDTIIYELDNNNTILQNKIQKFQSTFEQYEKSKNNKQEQTINQYQIKIDQLNQTIKEKNIQYEKLKKMSSESTQELIDTNNENSEIKKVIKQLQLEKNNLIKKIEEDNYTIQSLKETISSHEEQLIKLNNEKEIEENNFNLKNKELKNENLTYKNQIDEMNNYIIQLNSENKKIKFEITELKKSKEEFTSILKNIKNYEIENTNLKNLLEQYKLNYEETNEKYNELKIKHDELNKVIEEREKQLLQAMGEMEGYSTLLEQIEERIRKAEEERDKAVNDVKTIRQRYINMLGEEK